MKDSRQERAAIHLEQTAVILVFIGILLFAITFWRIVYLLLRDPTDYGYIVHIAALYFGIELLLAIFAYAAYRRAKHLKKR